MLGDKLSLVEEACAFVRQELDAGNRLPLGSCLNHSLALRYVLSREGFDARITGGEAFWSLGPGTTDALWFHPINGDGGYHFWCEIIMPAGKVNVDGHTYAIERIAR